MNINEAIMARVTQLCQERNLSPTQLVSQASKDITLDAVDTICAKFHITVADFFNSDLFRNLSRN